MDDTIKNSDDVEKYLGLSTLALIPLDTQSTGGRGRKSGTGISGYQNKSDTY